MEPTLTNIDRIRYFIEDWVVVIIGGIVLLILTGMGGLIEGILD